MSEIQQLYRIDRETLEGMSNALKEIKQDDTPIDMGGIVGEIEALNINDALAECEEVLDEIEAALDENTVERENKLAKVVGRSVTEIMEKDLNGVTQIGIYAFYKCTSLTSIEIPNSVTSILDSAFSYCTSLTSIEIPNSVTRIGSGAFYNCTVLTSVIIGNSVTSIGDQVFYNCSNLKSIIIPATTPPQLSATAFTKVSKECEFYVPAESVDVYKSATNWSAYADQIYPITEE